MQAILDDNFDPDSITQECVPADAAELWSDEDSEDEEDTTGAGMDVNHLGKGMLRQAGEVVYNDWCDDEPDIQVINDAGEVLEEIMDETSMQDNQQGEVEQREDEPVRGEPSKRRRTAAAEVLPVQCVQLGRKKNKEHL